jgi:hypothetical protein
MRIQQAVSANLIFQWQRLCFELDPVIARNVRPDIQFRGFLQIPVAELENDLWVTSGEAVRVANTPPQNECVIVESKISRIPEEHFPDLRLRGQPLVDKTNTELLCSLRDQLAIVEEGLCRRETVGLQDELALEILDIIQRMPVAILAPLEIRDSIAF